MTPVSPLPLPPALLGESPFWHPGEHTLYWCDIAGHAIHRFDPKTHAHREWPWDCDLGCVTPLLAGGLLVAARDGLWRFDPDRGDRALLQAPPYDPTTQRFNDGKADPQGRFWVGSLCEPRWPARAHLYRWTDGQLQTVLRDVSVSNGLAWSPDSRTLYWSDTRTHEICAFDVDPDSGSLGTRRTFARFAPKPDDGDLSRYGGRPDGAAVDVEGHYWVAMFEGGRVLRIAPDGTIAARLDLPVRCPTMPCFGGPDLKTLYITTARHHRPADELHREPWAGCVLQTRVDVPGLPVNFARL